jgi:hypothetical protein
MIADLPDDYENFKATIFETSADPLVQMRGCVSKSSSGIGFVTATYSRAHHLEGRTPADRKSERAICGMSVRIAALLALDRNDQLRIAMAELRDQIVNQRAGCRFGRPCHLVDHQRTRLRREVLRLGVS